MPFFSNRNGFVFVPSSFIKDKLPGANPTFVKVYLYLALIASEEAECSYSDIANTLGLLESDLMQAITYWETQGVLSKSGESILFTESASSQSPQASHESDYQPKKVENLADIIKGDQALSDMFMLSQEILGKTITEKEMETMYWFYSDLKMSPEVILLLLEHCVSKGKNRMSYIEKVAVSWNEMGLNNSESVAAYLKSEEQKTGFLYSIRKIMGISDRSLSQIEEKYLFKWHDEFEMSEEMIALAYEYCIIQTAKLSFPYMDKILTRWHSEGIKTVEDAESDNRKFKNKAKPSEAAFIEGYDHEALEKLSRT